MEDLNVLYEAVAHALKQSNRRRVVVLQVNLGSIGQEIMETQMEKKMEAWGHVGSYVLQVVSL